MKKILLFIAFVFPILLFGQTPTERQVLSSGTALTRLPVAKTTTVAPTDTVIVFKNGAWIKTIVSALSIPFDSSKTWSTHGNSGTTAGTNFSGTTDSVDVVFKTNAKERMRILANGGKIKLPLPVYGSSLDGSLVWSPSDSTIKIVAQAQAPSSTSFMLTADQTYTTTVLSDLPSLTQTLDSGTYTFDANIFTNQTVAGGIQVGFKILSIGTNTDIFTCSIINYYDNATGLDGSHQKSSTQVFGVGGFGSISTTTNYGNVGGDTNGGYGGGSSNASLYTLGTISAGTVRIHGSIILDANSQLSGQSVLTIQAAQDVATGTSTILKGSSLTVTKTQ